MGSATHTDDTARLRDELEAAKLAPLVKAAFLAAGGNPDDADGVATLTREHFKLDIRGRVVVLDDDGDPTGQTPERWMAETYRRRRPKYFGEAPPPSAAGHSGERTRAPKVTARSQLRGVAEKVAFISAHGFAAFRDLDA